MKSEKEEMISNDTYIILEGKVMDEDLGHLNVICVSFCHSFFPV